MNEVRASDLLGELRLCRYVGEVDSIIDRLILETQLVKADDVFFLTQVFAAQWWSFISSHRKKAIVDWIATYDSECLIETIEAVISSDHVQQLHQLRQSGVYSCCASVLRVISIMPAIFSSLFHLVDTLKAHVHHDPELFECITMYIPHSMVASALDDSSALLRLIMRGYSSQIASVCLKSGRFDVLQSNEDVAYHALLNWDESILCSTSYLTVHLVQLLKTVLISVGTLSKLVNVFCAHSDTETVVVAAEGVFGIAQFELQAQIAALVFTITDLTVEIQARLMVSIGAMLSSLDPCVTELSQALLQHFIDMQPESHDVFHGFDVVPVEYRKFFTARESALPDDDPLKVDVLEVDETVVHDHEFDWGGSSDEERDPLVDEFLGRPKHDERVEPPITVRDAIRMVEDKNVAVRECGLRHFPAVLFMEGNVAPLAIASQVKPILQTMLFGMDGHVANRRQHTQRVVAGLTVVAAPRVATELSKLLYAGDCGPSHISSCLRGVREGVRLLSNRESALDLPSINLFLGLESNTVSRINRLNPVLAEIGLPLFNALSANPRFLVDSIILDHLQLANEMLRCGFSAPNVKVMQRLAGQLCEYAMSSKSEELQLAGLAVARTAGSMNETGEVERVLSYVSDMDAENPLVVPMGKVQ
ncbi:hypothetical protein PCE1_001100 [Barthelona sp. PCE]